MSSLYTYEFNRNGRIGNDFTDRTQRNIMNTQFSDYTLSNPFVDGQSGPDHVQFALSQPAVMYRGVVGGGSGGIMGTNVDTDTALTMNPNERNCRSLEKLCLQTRPFLTVPYLGRGSCDPSLESQLQQGEYFEHKKSINTISEQTFMNHSMYPLIDDIKNTVTNPQFLIQEAALDGWVRGGSNTRNAMYDQQKK